MTTKNDPPKTVHEPVLRPEDYRTALVTLENTCKNVIAFDEPNSSKFVDDTLRYLSAVRREVKRLNRIERTAK